MEANAIYSFSEVTLKLLEHEKRHARRYAIHELITEAVELLDPYIKLREAKVDFDFAAEDPQIWCSKAAFEAIITNFLTNSLQAFIREDKEEQAVESKQRNILFRTKIIDKKVVLVVADSGPGIKDISIDDIWLPGKTTTVKGTGLGLSIVRDVITDLGGSIDAEAKSEFGGAKFTVILPVKE
jgi:C4-dicarboxylate-specific signal transduction histidine kinase